MHLPWPFSSSTPSTTISKDAANSAQPSIDAATSQTPETSSSRLLTRAERARQADLEFAELVKSFEASTTEQTTATRGTAQAAQTTKTSLIDLQPRIYEDGTIDIRPEIMHPQSMNCRQAFDQAFYCQSLGGKFNDIYRHGEFRSCSEQWAAFWFCMRTRTMDDAGKAAQTVEYYKDRDEKRKKLHGNSEDVWEIRTRSLKRAFWKDPDELSKQDYQD